MLATAARTNQIQSRKATECQFDYTTHFGEVALGKQALEANKNFKGFARKTFKGLVEVGRTLWEVQNQSCQQLGATIGKRKFKEWLTSKEFGGSRYLADAAMIVSQWYDDLPKSMQRLVASRVDCWSVAALLELPKLTLQMVEKLVRSGKHTAKKIRSITAPTKNPPKAKTRKIYPPQPEIDLTTLEIGDKLIFSPPERTEDPDLDELIGCTVLYAGKVEAENSSSGKPKVIIRNILKPSQTPLVCELNEVTRADTAPFNLESQAEIKRLREENALLREENKQFALRMRQFQENFKQQVDEEVAKKLAEEKLEAIERERDAAEARNKSLSDENAALKKQLAAALHKLQEIESQSNTEYNPSAFVDGDVESEENVSESTDLNTLEMPQKRLDLLEEIAHRMTKCTTLQELQEINVEVGEDLMKKAWKLLSKTEQDRIKSICQP